MSRIGFGMGNALCKGVASSSAWPLKLHETLKGSQKETVMKRIFSKFSLVVASTLITSGVWAQAQTKALKATIPFDFTVNNKTLPAGTYTVKSEDSIVVSFSDPSQKGAQVLGVVQPETAKKDQGNALVFHRYGDRYFLSEIRSQNSALNSSLAITKSEKLAKIQTQDTAVTQWPSNDIMVALR
jgi:hypothetical protein